MADPFQRGGEWWTQRDDGGWLKWDRSLRILAALRRSSPARGRGTPPVPPMPVGTSGYPATPIGAQTPIPNYLV